MVGDAPNGTGVRQNLSMQKSILQQVSNAEIWTISADLVSYDAISIRSINDYSVGISSINETARKISIDTFSHHWEYSFAATDAEVIAQHDLTLNSWYIITVYDDEDLPIHRSVSYPLSGLKILTTLATGEHEINLVNNARIEHFYDASWEISNYPSVIFEKLATEGYRCSILLTNIDVNGSLGVSNSYGLDILSTGALTPFVGQSYNLRFSMESTLAAVITPQYNELWLSDYYLNRASGTLDSFTGLAPYERLSGMDGITVETNGEPLFLDVSVQQVVLER